MVHPSRSTGADEAGYTLLEVLFATALLMTVSAGIFDGMLRLSRVNETVNNRSSMHAGTRNATELLQQEVGQAGRIAFGGALLTAPIIGDPDAIQTIAVSTTTGMFIGEKLHIHAGTGCNAAACGEETVQITAFVASPPTITAKFQANHTVNAAIDVRGGFAAGVVPPNATNGSTATVLKLFGDINDDGNMVYVEYSCDLAGGNLYRNQIAWNAAAPSPAANVSQILLNNIQPNPGNTACFTYETRTIVGVTYVIDVAITLTVQTSKRDVMTGMFQTETKALLNVAPRNVYEVWQMASMNMTNRVQVTPPSITALLP